MGTFAHVDTGTVVNIAMADVLEDLDPQWTWVDISSADPTPGIGWNYSGGVFTDPNPPPGPTDAELAQVAYKEKIADGITLTCTSIPDINGTYAYDQITQTDLAGIAATIGLSAVGGGTAMFPDGTTSGYQYPQQGGFPITVFPSVTAFQKFYLAYAMLLQQLRTQTSIMAAGGTPSWPSQSVDIP